MSNDEMKIKAEKYDELQKWFWWLERRTNGGNTSKTNVETFLTGIKEYFEPYED